MARLIAYMRWIGLAALLVMVFLSATCERKCRAERPDLNQQPVNLNQQGGYDV